jgi:hypothetical protein
MAAAPALLRIIGMLRATIPRPFRLPANAPRIRPGPSTNPMAPHNLTIRELGDALTALENRIEAGGGRLREVEIPTPGGLRTVRRPDIIYRTPSGERRAINVGRTRADGTPLPREVEALRDLNVCGDLPTRFIPYDR